jgi:hypothetical protein
LFEQSFGLFGEVEVGVEDGMHGKPRESGNQLFGPFLRSSGRSANLALNGLSKTLDPGLMMTKYPLSNVAVGQTPGDCDNQINPSNDRFRRDKPDVSLD